MFRCPDALSDDAETLVRAALKNRPELSVAKLNQSAAERFAEAEKKLRYPAISAVGVVGIVPIHQKNFPDQYSAAGLNISIPFLNGGLYCRPPGRSGVSRARRGQRYRRWLYRSRPSVRVAWIEADNAWRGSMSRRGLPIRQLPLYGWPRLVMTSA